MHILIGADMGGSVRGMISDCCLGESYCRRGIPMLKTRIQLPAVSGGQPAAWMLSLAQITERYAEQTLLPAVCEAYDSLRSVAEKMHFEPYGYRQCWHTEPHPDSTPLLTVRIETELSRGAISLRRTETVITVDRESGQIVKSKLSRNGR